MYISDPEKRKQIITSKVGNKCTVHEYCLMTYEQKLKFNTVRKIK